MPGRAFTVLPGLPGVGPRALPFPESGWGAHSEGLVVRFEPRASEPWIGNFQRGGGGCDGVLAHPNGEHVFVVSRGYAYVVDPESRREVAGFDGIYHMIEVPLLRAVVFSNDVAFEAIRADGLWWQSPRVSWDGVRNLTVIDTDLHGEAFSPLSGLWHPFRLDLLTGTCSGSEYQDDMSRAIRVVPRRGRFDSQH